MALKHGARTIEHGALLGPAEIDSISSHKAYLVLTLGRFFDPEGIERSAAGNAAILTRLTEARKALRGTVPRAIEARVNVVLGTDNMHGRLWSDVEWLQKLGTSFAFALSAVTGRAAKALQRDHRVGFVRPGLRADLIAVAGDPRTSPAGLREVVLVIKAGRVEWASPVVQAELARAGGPYAAP
jgi:imidazolonepropionase-like amidohydrolase